MSLFQSLLTDSGVPVVPPSYDVTAFSTAGTASGLVSTRQTSLEPSVAGVDRAFSFSCWINSHNLDVNSQTAFGVGDPSTGARQWDFFLRSQTETASTNQKSQFTLTNGANNIRCLSSKRFLRNRWYHVVGTYSGSETSAGLNLYFNKVLDSTATHDSAGTYTGALNTSALRMQISRVIATGHFRGHLRDLALWDIELDQTQVDELYNNNVPIDVDTVSFYGNIEAYWPLRTTATCLNSATFNFGSLTGVSFTTRPISAIYPGFSMQNARVGSTRYVAFQTALRFGSTIQGWIGSGTTHVVDTRIDKYIFSFNDLLATTPVVWVDNVLNDIPDGLRGGQVGIVNGNLNLFTSQYDDVALAFNDFGRYVSSDGSVGEAFGAFISMESPAVGESINAYGNCIAGDDAGEYFVAYHEYTVAAQTISVWHTTDNGANWNKVTCFTGDSTKGYNEPCILKVGVDTYVMLVREQAGAIISCSVTTDNFATCSIPVDSTLAVGTGMAAMCLDDDGNIVVSYADRGDGLGKISLGNVVADILANPADWNAGSGVFQTIDKTINILGYPFIINCGSGFFASGFSSEQNPPSATRADFFIGYGHFGA